MSGKKQSSSFVMSVAYGILLSVLTAMICTAVAAILILREKVDEAAIGFVALVIIFISVFTGALFAGKMSSGRYGTVCAAGLLSFLLLQVGTNVIFFDGNFHAFIKSIICEIVGGGLACVLLMKTKTGKRRRRR